MIKVKVNYDGKIFEGKPVDETPEKIKDAIYGNLEKLEKMYIETEKGLIFFGEDVLKRAIFEIEEVL